MQELEDEVADLKAEVRKAWRVIRELRAAFTPGEESQSDSRSHSDSRAAHPRSPSASYSVSSPSPDRRGEGLQSVPETRGPSAAYPSSAPGNLTWLEREAICDQIGCFLARSISGDQRGTSGRDKIPLASKLWIVVRDYSGQIYTPVKVVRSWTTVQGSLQTLQQRVRRQRFRGAAFGEGSQASCGGSAAGLAQRNRTMSLVEQAPWPADLLPYVYTEGKINTVYSVGLFVVDQATLTPTLQAIQIGEFEGQLLVCVPHSVWHRTPARRILPSNCLTKHTLVEVAGARPGNLSQEVEGAVVEVWIGYLRAQYYKHLEILEEYNAEYCFVDQTEELMLPLARALCEVAQEHFAFFSADGWDLPGAIDEEDINGEPFDSQDVGLLDGDVSPVEARMSKMETAITDLAKEVKKIAASSKGAPKKKAAAKATGKSKAVPKVAGLPSTAAGDVAAAYPLLDRGVVASALQAEIPHSTLEQMQKLVGQGTKASKVKDMNKKVSPIPLSEDEHVIEDEHYSTAEGYGLEPADPMTATLQKLTSIVEILTDKKKKATISKLETALHGVASSSTDNPLQGTGKKAAAARRALRGAFQDHPEEIFGLIERLMAEDLTSATVGPGMDRPLISARAWVEHRSRITSFKTGAHAA